jgi:phage-related minor tail protein
MMADETDVTGEVLTTLNQLGGLDETMRQLQKSSDAFGRAISGSLARGITDGRRFDDVLKSIGRSLIQSTLKSALNPLFSGIGTALSSSLTGLFSGGATAAAQPVVPFADGGIVASPASFPMGRQMGLMGERGAEAILPLARGPDGKLGVRAGEGRASSSVIVNIATSDADSFRRSEAQVSAAIARAVARGNRSL